MKSLLKYPIIYIFIEIIVYFFIKLIENLLNININTDLLRIIISLILGIIFIPLLKKEYKKYNVKEKNENYIYYIVLFISISLTYNVIGFYISRFFNIDLYGSFNIISAIISTTIIGPIIEEYMFRGIIYNESKKIYSKTKATIITTLLFSLLHLNIIQIIYTLLIGYLLIKIYDRTNIKTCIKLHMILNLTTTIVSIILVKNYSYINLLIFITGISLLLFVYNKKNDIIK